jgi:tetratricopeptide (TPR) repeat protein
MVIDESHCRHKKMFFTTSDLVGQMNSAMGVGRGAAATSNENKHDDDEVRGFELHTRMPDGSYRPTQSNELAAVDFQSKIKQAAESIVGLDGRQKLEWASRQRRMGNELFAAGEYREAMDVYLTCLVAVDRGDKRASSSSSLLDDDGNSINNKSMFDRMEEEIQLPVLLNLALSAMKMGMLGKAEKFCNHAIDETSCGKLSPKAYFRRGRVRLLMGNYVDAESDLDAALGLLQRLYDFEEENGPILLSVQNGEVTTTPCDVIVKRMEEIETERMVILREKERLNSLVRQAERAEKVQKRAMERLFGGLSSNLIDEGDPSLKSSLYPEKQGLSRRHTRNIDGCNNESKHKNKTEDEFQPQLTYFRWYMCMIGRCAQKLLHLIGEAEEDDDDSMLYLANTYSFKGEKDA